MQSSRNNVEPSRAVQICEPSVMRAVTFVNHVSRETTVTIVLEKHQTWRFNPRFSRRLYETIRNDRPGHTRGDGHRQCSRPNRRDRQNLDAHGCASPIDTGKRRSYMHTSGASAAYAISSQTKLSEEAWKVFSFLYSKDSAVRYSSYSEGLRVYPDSAKSMTGVAAQLAKIGTDDVKIQPSFTQVRPQIVDVKLNPVAKGLAYHILAAASGQLQRGDVKAALKQVNTDYNAELKRAVDAAAKAGVKVKLEDFKFGQWKPNEDFTTEELVQALK
jgi:hypothetical protein